MTHSPETAERTVELDAPPHAAGLLARAPLAARGGASQLPDVELVLADVTVDRQRLAAYDRVCGFTVRDALPATFPHVLAFPLQVALMVDHPFPLALPRLIHVRNRITQHRGLTADERVTLAVRAQRWQAHPKGATVDLVSEASVGGEVVWRGVSTYLQRGAAGPGPHTGSSGDAPDVDVDVPDEPAAVWSVPRDVGRRYAAVAGDYNPIHLHPAAARLAGFRRTIAHGMWTAARCLAALEPRVPAAATFDVAFKTPLVVPARVGLHTAAHGGRRAVAMRDVATGAPHLEGTIDPAA